MQPVSEERKDSSKMMGALVAVILLLVGGYVFLSSPDESVSSGMETVSIEPVAHQVTLDSVPSGADLFINGKIGGSTPATLKVEEESLEIQLVLEGYETREFSITKDTQEEMVIRLRAVLIDPEPTPKEEEPIREAKPKPSPAKKSSKPKLPAAPKAASKKPAPPPKGASKKKGELKETEWD